MQGVLERLQAMGQGCGEWHETSECILFHLVTQRPNKVACAGKGSKKPGVSPRRV